jgi:hypothetical protein
MAFVIAVTIVIITITTTTTIIKDAQIPVAKSPSKLKFVQ